MSTYGERGFDGAPPYITDATIGTTYRRGLARYTTGLPHNHLVLLVEDPIVSAANIDSLDVTDWEDTPNLGWEYDVFCPFEFDRTSGFVDGNTGKDWLNDRLHELYEGMYATRLEDPDQLEMVIRQLQTGHHGSCTNALVVQVFRDGDLELATQGTPNADGMACMTQLQFRPRKDTLDLYMTLRTQYVDLKGYGNLVAAATLLSKVCERTGYAPGILVEYVNNAIAYDADAARRLRHRFDVEAYGDPPPTNVHV